MDADFTERLKALEGAVENRDPVPVVEAPPPANRRALFWTAAAVLAALILAGEIGLAVRDRPHGAAPSPTLERLLEREPCVRRLERIADALDAYAAAHGGPPPDLQSFAPDAYPARTGRGGAERRIEYHVGADGTVSVDCLASPAATRPSAPPLAAPARAPSS